MVSYLNNSNEIKLSSKNIASVRRTIVPNSSRIVPVSEQSPYCAPSLLATVTVDRTAVQSHWAGIEIRKKL